MSDGDYQDDSRQAPAESYRTSLYLRVAGRHETLMKLVRNAVKDGDEDGQQISPPTRRNIQSFVRRPENEHAQKRVPDGVEVAIRKGIQDRCR